MVSRPTPRFAIGIDTGGTYTDAVVIETASRRVVATAKALTTKGDLAVGVTEALERVLDGAGGPGPHPAALGGDEIALVSLSTTLATNAIVEGHGSPVAMILIGFDDAMARRTQLEQALPGTRILRVAGGHDHAGHEQSPLDLAAVEAFLDETGVSVDAYAVAAQWSVRNATHEHRVRDLIEARVDRAASLSSDLAHALDAPRRALTAALNARIVTRITGLIAAVRLAMGRHGIHAPLMIVKGDGTLASADAVALRPIETILSGPAASVIGAKFLTGLDDFVIADIGGTTTDIAVVEGGWPRLDRNGASVGGRQTLVRAIDMRTFGLGGDSEIASQGAGNIVLQAERVVPLSLLASQWPSMLDVMRRALADPQGEPHAGRFVLRPFGHGGASHSMAGLSEAEEEMLERVRLAPAPMGVIAHGPSQQRRMKRLVSFGLLAIAAFTPSDAAHVLDMQGQWSREGAVLGALLLERRIRMARPMQPSEQDEAARRFAREVFDATVAKSARVLLESLAGGAPDSASGMGFLDAAASGKGRFGHVAVSLRPASPLVAVGGPAPVFYPELGRRLGCPVILPDHGDVANAVGAAVGVVKVQVVIDVSSVGPGSFRIHAGGNPLVADDPARALAMATDIARTRALEEAAARGAGGEPHVDIHVDRVDLPDMAGDTGLIAATIIAESWAAPQV